jgi:hypothetical protein
MFHHPSSNNILLIYLNAILQRDFTFYTFIDDESIPSNNDKYIIFRSHLPSLHPPHSISQTLNTFRNIALPSSSIYEMTNKFQVKRIRFMKIWNFKNRRRRSLRHPRIQTNSDRYRTFNSSLSNNYEVTAHL